MSVSGVRFRCLAAPRKAVGADDAGFRSCMRLKSGVSGFRSPMYIFKSFIHNKDLYARLFILLSCIRSFFLPIDVFSANAGFIAFVRDV